MTVSWAVATSLALPVLSGRQAENIAAAKTNNKNIIVKYSVGAPRNYQAETANLYP